MAQFGRMHRFCRECLLHRNQMCDDDRSLHIPRDPKQHDQIVDAINRGAKSLFLSV